MLKPIPSRILRSTATVEVCTGIDMYQNQTTQTYTVDKVHLQPTHAIVKTKANTEMQLRSVLFVDGRNSSPKLDWNALFTAAHNIGGDMKVTIRNITYTVLSVDELRDDDDNFHHWEVGLA